MSLFDDQYLLTTSTAQELFESVKDLPIVDAHNHADIVEIVNNEHWSDIWEVEGATDHYIWSLMRKRGIDEKYITGNDSNKEKWQKLAGVMPDMIGNPVYDWLHLDLKRRFNIDLSVGEDTGEEIWQETQKQLQEDGMRPQSILEKMGVEIMCTTDDPTMDLPHHKQAREEIDRPRIFPTWRPDGLVNLEEPGWFDKIQTLGQETDINITSLEGLLDALKKTHDYFDRMGTVASDHGIKHPATKPVTHHRAETVYLKALEGGVPDQREMQDFKAFLLDIIGQMNKEKNWVTQLHIGPERDYRDSLYHSIGKDAGGDIADQNVEFASNLRYFLNQFDSKLQIVLYCVDVSHLPTIATIARAFPNVSLGAPWWWNDSPAGMRMHLEYISTVDLLANHAGMVTDSRKLLSFGSRTEMFRRTLCDILGSWVEKGRASKQDAARIARKLSYEQPKQLFFGNL